MQKNVAYLFVILFSLCFTIGCDQSEVLPMISTAIEKPVRGDTLKRTEPFEFQALIRSEVPLDMLELSMFKKGGGPAILVTNLVLNLSPTMGSIVETRLDTLLQVDADIEPGEYSLYFFLGLDCLKNDECDQDGTNSSVRIEIE